MSLQPGDVIALAQLAWDIYSYGWDSNLAASKEYAAFRDDVKTLAESLDLLDQVANRSKSSFDQLGGKDRIMWSPSMLFEVIGDYKKTLAECKSLLGKNRLYAETSGPRRNLTWHVLVQPDVDRLRQRITIHNTRIQNMLKPFEIDLLTWIHELLVRIAFQVDGLRHQIDGLRNQIIQVDQKLEELGCKLTAPSDGTKAPKIIPAVDSGPFVDIPTQIQDCLEDSFQRHANCRSGTIEILQDITDAINTNLQTSTALPQPEQRSGNTTAPPRQYACILKCVFLLNKAKTSSEFLHPRLLSHWPSYIRHLDEQVSRECERLGQIMIVPEPKDITAEMLTLWPEKEDTHHIQSFDEMLEELLDVEQAGGTPQAQKRLKLFRHINSPNKIFRLSLYTLDLSGQSPRPRDENRTNFNIANSNTALIPLYAMPVEDETDISPLNFMLEANNSVQELQFCNLPDVLRFQWALTGFKVADNYTEPRAKAKFIISGQEHPKTQDATVQLWLPRYFEGTPPSSESDAASSRSPVDSISQTSPTRGSQTQTETLPRSDVFPSARNGVPEPFPSTSPNRRFLLERLPFRTRTMSQNVPVGPKPLQFRRPRRSESDISTISTGSTTLVSNSGQSRTGVMHIKPTKPMLVLFTREMKSNLSSSANGSRPYAIVAMDIDEATKSNADRCNCKKDPEVCRVTALEQAKGKRNLGARRFDSGTWNVLPLALKRRSADDELKDVRRISIIFPDVRGRKVFGGVDCSCERPGWNQGQETKCMLSGHIGLLGHMRVKYRRAVEDWAEKRYGNNQEIVSTSSTSYRGAPGLGIY